MPHIRGTVHGVAAMVTLVVGSMLTDAIREEYELFAQIAATTTHLLIDVAELPVSREIAAVVVPVGVLMGVWVFAYELQRLLRAE
ncbi:MULTISPECIES: hypothetical protein [Halorubrum]|uniref:Uncharacterized protein n=1 Tax=Halorubrum ezzemoulense TaxID=337243 RepID=A0A238V9L3_HALEZ|nr:MULTISPECIES: hypothetical protein [Halorubrum]MDB2236289.1 hypothetical protein [Halorubrum ezzemoulense]MDB2241353.1 hypothetical protein [Halorubrum ezzemoulense]MDB2248423.1 hypothetical protein [Halorubrum ezzemoulense]MDB2259420.1 hypothetical protein [Halorubrum ezzemoulense]MDB2263569.1 hypothetical protein [Halorubrum ezzemoulense]